MKCKTKIPNVQPFPHKNNLYHSMSAVSIISKEMEWRLFHLLNLDLDILDFLCLADWNYKLKFLYHLNIISYTTLCMKQDPNWFI